MTNLKKLLAVLLCITMLAGLLAACTPAETNGTGSGDKETTGNTTGGSEVAYPDYVKEPITITFWHNVGGDLNDALVELTEEFNKTNEYGITVVLENQGGYNDILIKLKASYGTETNCNMAIVGAGGIEELACANKDADVAHAGCFADLSGYVARDNFDLENIPETLRYYMQHFEGQVIVFPQWVSTTLIAYNKAYYTEEPTTLEEWVKMASDIHSKNNIYGMAQQLDFGFMQRPVLKSLGAPGLTTEDGNAPALIGDGDKEIETYLNDWQSWIKDGYCFPMSVTDTSTKMFNEFYAGTLASFEISSANITTITNNVKDTNIDVGYCASVGYGGQYGAIGGGSVAVMADNTQQEVAACWEFIKWLNRDESQVTIHKASGYLPFNYSAVNSEELKTFWEENPAYKVAYEALDNGTYNDWSLHLNEWRSQISTVFSYCLVDGSMTAEEGIQYLKTQATIIFD